MQAVAVFLSENASRYLTALCDHFGRKIEAQSDGHSGYVILPFGRCDITANETGLKLIATAENRTDLDEITHIITRHLERFAFRENPHLTWQPVSGSSAR